MKKLIYLMILLAVLYGLYYAIFVFDYIREFGVSPWQMRRTIAEKVKADYLDYMSKYLWAQKPSEQDILNATNEQIDWINAIKLKSNTSQIPNELLYDTLAYTDQVNKDLNFLLKERGVSELSNPNQKERVKVILNSFGLDYTNDKTAREFNKQFDKYVR